MIEEKGAETPRSKRRRHWIVWAWDPRDVSDA